MFFGLFKRRPPAEPSPAETAYEQVVAAARRPELYRDLSAPDTLPGRFELTVLHVALVMRRLRADGGPEALRFSQELFDAMFRALDANLREIGIGDATVPKRVKAMARSFFDGSVAYDLALDARDADALGAALKRIVYARAEAAEDAARRLAAYVLSAEAALAAQPVDDLVAAGPAFPAVEGGAP